MNIPQEAIEAAARATWDDVDYPNYDYHVELVAKAITAAAPIVVAQALREEAVQLAVIANYHPPLWKAVDDMRERADEMDAK